MSVIKTDEKYKDIISRLKRENAALKKENKLLQSEQIIKGTASGIRAIAYKEGYDTCSSQNAQEIEGMKDLLEFYQNISERFLSLKEPVSVTYRRLKEGYHGR